MCCTVTKNNRIKLNLESSYEKKDSNPEKNPTPYNKAYISGLTEKHIFSLIVHHLKTRCSVAAGRVPPSFIPSFKS